MLLVVTTVIELTDEHFADRSDNTKELNRSNVLRIANEVFHEELRNEYGKPSLRKLTSTAAVIPDNGERL